MGGESFGGNVEEFANLKFEPVQIEAGCYRS
jgi:hypothetical protein